MKLLSPILLFLLTGCSVLEPVKDSAVHHLLEPLVADRPLSAATPAIAINRPSLPSYLDRQQLVIRRNGQLMISKLDLWAEPLDAAIARVMASNLSRLTGSLNIQPVQSFTSTDYTGLLELNVGQFEPDDAQQMMLNGTWKLQPVSGKETGTHYFRIAVPLPSSAAVMKDRVSAMNIALEKLAREIMSKR